MATDSYFDSDIEIRTKKNDIKSNRKRKKIKNRRVYETMPSPWKELWKNNAKNQKIMELSNERIHLKDMEKRKLERLFSNHRSATLKPEWKIVFKT
jgi:hypothetical protein